MEDNACIRALDPGELDLFVSYMSPSKIDMLGSQCWIEWHNRFQKLQQQAVIEVSSLEEEATKEAIISYGKIPVLIHEAICISVWRQKILPKILSSEPNLPHTFLLYAVLYHETVAVGLLEIVLFDEEACCAISDVLVDIIDYALEMITSLYTLVNSGYLDDKMTKSNSTSVDNKKEFEMQQKDLQYDIGMRCITIVSCLCNVLNKIHVSAMARFYETHDTIMLLCEIIQSSPWQARNIDDDLMQYIDGKWKKVDADDSDKVCRAETMCWLALWRLLLNPEISHYYQINNSRKTQLCKLLYRMTDAMVDQIPVLMDLKRSLGQLAVSDVSTASKPSKAKPLLIQVVPQIKASIMKKVNKKCKSIANAQLEKFFKMSKEELVEIAKSLTSTYTSDVLEHLDDGGAKCANCGDKAAKKCSRCKMEWYCGRECQVKRWLKHKDLCDHYYQLVQ